MKNSEVMVLIIASFCEITCIEDGEIPLINFCVADHPVLVEVMECFLGRLPAKPAADYRRTMSEIFPGLDIGEAMQLLCKNNDDDGYTLLVTWLDEINVELRRAAIRAVWECHSVFTGKGIVF